MIALAILGLIATFTIPKVLQNVETQRKKALFKETIGVLSSVIYQGMLENKLYAGPGPNFREAPYLLSKLNYKDAGSDQGNPFNWAGPNLYQNCFGIMLMNGVAISGFNMQGNGGPALIDYNGQEGPNLLGQDQLWLYMTYDDGRVGLVTDRGQANIDLYKSLWE